MLLRGSIFSFFGFFLFVSGVFAQDHGHGEFEQCGFDTWLRANPEVARDFHENMERALLHKQKRETHLRSSLGEAYELLQDPVYTLPIVVHVLHRPFEAIGGETNVEKRFIDNMIAELNAYFSATQPNRVIPPEYQDVDGGDMGIRFALARRDPNGLPTDGIIRLPMPAGIGFLMMTNNDVAEISPQWDRRKYINVWVVPEENTTSITGTILGSARFPFSPHLDGLGRGVVNASSQGTLTISGYSPGDGVLMISTVVGGGVPNSRGDLPKTLVHEIGHYLGLFHPWSGGNPGSPPLELCNVDDGCVDTPRTSSPTRATRTSASTACSATPNCFKGSELQFPMVQNYMDYSADRCQHMFTLCQRERMRTVLESTTFRRTLWEGNDALTPVDDALLVLENNIGFTSLNGRHDNCATGVLFEDIELVNYGANPINSIEVQFFIREGSSATNDMEYGSKRTIDFSPALASQARSTLFRKGSGLTIPIAADLYDGRVSLRIMSVNGVEDREDDYGRNTYIIFVDKERVENKLHALEFSVDSDGDDDINFGAAASYRNAFSIETGSKGNQLLRIHRVHESAADGHALAIVTSPFMSVSEIINEGGADYALGLRLRYSYVSNDLSEGDNFALVLFDCQNRLFAPFDGTDVDGATSYYPERSEVPHDRTFREFHFPLPLSRDGRITTYDAFSTETRLSDSVRVALFAWNGGGSDLFIENLSFTRTLTRRIYLVWISVY